MSLIFLNSSSLSFVRGELPGISSGGDGGTDSEEYGHGNLVGDDPKIGGGSGGGDSVGGGGVDSDGGGGGDSDGGGGGNSDGGGGGGGDCDLEGGEHF